MQKECLGVNEYMFRNVFSYTVLWYNCNLSKILTRKVFLTKADSGTDLSNRYGILGMIYLEHIEVCFELPPNTFGKSDLTDTFSYLAIPKLFLSSI